MIYPFTLETTLTLVGWLLITAHVFALIRGKAAQQWLRRFPRSKVAGFILLTIAAVWSWLLILNIDLGEFSNWRTRILVLIPIAAILTLKYVDEFLAARALGMVALLAAEPLLDSAWLRPELGRLALVSLAYVWIGFALFWIGMPYTLRDQIAWLTSDERRWKVGVIAGVGYGLLLVILPLTLRHSA
jgi:hypothetical protein